MTSDQHSPMTDTKGLPPAPSGGDAGPKKSGRSKRRRGRALVIALAALFILIVAGVFAASWYFSDQLLDVTHSPNTYGVTVLSHPLGAVTLSRSSAIVPRQGVYGLYWPGGHAVVGRVTSTNATSATRLLVGPAPGLRPGLKARMDVFVYPTPAAVHEPYRTVTVHGPLGSMPAWFVPGRRGIWAIVVHGYTSNRREGIRIMPALSHLGLPILAISYRNDAGDPASPDHLYHLGGTEWLDLQAAARYARSHGATGFVLYGYSMGGNIVEEFLHRSSLARYTRAVVLDSPALDWSAILNLAAAQRNLPGALAATTSEVVAWRLGMLSLAPIDELTATGGPIRPTLLFHCTGDTLVPIASSDAFARAHRSFVTYVRVSGADHTQAWNVGPARYDAAVSRFLAAHT